MAAVAVSLYLNQKYEIQKQINKKKETLTYRQKIQAENDTEKMISQTNDLRNKISNLGIPVLPVNNQEIENIVTDAAVKASDAAIKSNMQQAIPPTAEIYFDYHHGNFGVSASSNICVDPSLDSIKQWITSIDKYSKTPAKCVVSSSFPAKTFTVTVPSLVNDGLYCTDQNGFAGIIATNSNQFVVGEKCK